MFDLGPIGLQYFSMFSETLCFSFTFVNSVLNLGTFPGTVVQNRDWSQESGENLITLQLTLAIANVSI